ncbi:unnamed protein product, partial [Anisakis simplex]|uniref:AcetylCoA_hydro domain-containing protein n=1 Tax=Anisakis simplex TaxID=6269 RepID=A0A0M3K9T9_ANISI
MLSRALAPAKRCFSTSPALLRIVPGSLVEQECGYPIKGKKTVLSDIKNAFNGIRSGDNIFIHGIAATPTPLLFGLCDYAKANDLKGIKLHHLHLEGPTPWTAEDMKHRIRSNSLFTGGNLRKAVNDGTADFNSTFLHEVPLLFRTGAIKLDAAIIHVSPPDENGFCSLGTSVDTACAAVKQANHIIAMTNKHMPRTFGDSVIHQSHIDVMIELNDHPLHERPVGGPASPEEMKIGKIIADNLVDNGATLQMGIGAIPDAALAAMGDHKDLGIHTEMFSDGVLDLVECNAITNAKKPLHPGKVSQCSVSMMGALNFMETYMVVSFVYGTKKLY